MQIVGSVGTVFFTLEYIHSVNKSLVMKTSEVVSVCFRQLLGMIGHAHEMFSSELFV